LSWNQLCSKSLNERDGLFATVPVLLLILLIRR
jgi:hypothetical protein